MTLDDLVSFEDPLGWAKPRALSSEDVRLSRALAYFDSSGQYGIAAMRMLSHIVESGREELLSSKEIDLLHQLTLLHDPGKLRGRRLHPLPTAQVASEINADLQQLQRSQGANHLEWVRAFSSAVGIECSLPEVAWASGMGDAFDHLEFAPDEASDSNGPSVSTITSCYRPSRGLVSAIKSLCFQSWTNLEIIVVDDGSGPEFEEILHEVDEMDPRVRVVRNQANRGTFARRNQGLNLARGCYVTFQDADDISTPDRIRRHVEAMEADKSLVATISTCSKVEPTLWVTRPGYRARDANAQSLMLRASVALPLLGYFHEVRRGADGEYIRRIKASLGEQAIGTVHDSPLMLYRRTPGSLSSVDFSPGRRSRRRWAYQMMTNHSHRHASGNTRFFVSGSRAKSNDFGIVDSTAQTSPRTPQTFDVGFLADFRAANPGLGALQTDINEMRARGMRVAVAQCDRPDELTPTDESLATWVLDAILAGEVSLLVDDSAALLTHLVVENAESLAVGLVARASWTASSVELRNLSQHGDDEQTRLAVQREAATVLEMLGVIEIGMHQRSLRRSQSTLGAPAATVAIARPRK